MTSLIPSSSSMMFSTRGASFAKALSSILSSPKGLFTLTAGESSATRRIEAVARTGDVTHEEIISKLETLLNKVSDNDDARKEYVDLLDVLGSESEEANLYRRKLSSKLF